MGLMPSVGSRLGMKGKMHPIRTYHTLNFVFIFIYLCLDEVFGKFNASQWIVKKQAKQY